MVLTFPHYRLLVYFFFFSFCLLSSQRSWNIVSKSLSQLKFSCCTLNLKLKSLSFLFFSFNIQQLNGVAVLTFILFLFIFFFRLPFSISSYCEKCRYLVGGRRHFFFLIKENSVCVWECFYASTVHYSIWYTFFFVLSSPLARIIAL